MLVLTNCASEAQAERLAATLVGDRLAACVNRVSGVQSTYWWQGAVQTDQEVLLVIKTTAERLEAVEATIRELSEYELPECIAVRVEAGSPAYLKWIGETVAE